MVIFIMIISFCVTMSYDSESKPRTKGDFVVGFIECVEEISSVFGKKTEEILAANGIKNPEPGETYPMDDVVSSINQIADEVGENTIHQIGIYQVTIPDWPEHVETIEDGFEAIQDMYVGAYEDFSVEKLGKFEFQKTGNREGRAAVTEQFPYPSSFARGVCEGVIQDLTGDSGGVITETDAQSGEKAAYEINW